jgi:signal transduction histidine kinase
MTAPIMAISVIPLAVGVFTAWHVQRQQKKTSDVLAMDVLSLRAAEELEIGIREVRTQLDRFLLTGDPKYLDEVPALRQETDYWLHEAVRAGITEHEQELMARVQQGYQHFFEEFDHCSRQAPAAGMRQEVRQLIDDVLTNEILLPAHEYLDFNEEGIARSSADNQRMADQMVLALLLLGTCGPAAGLLAGYGIARGVSRSLVRLSVPISAAAGKLNEIVGPVTISTGAGLDEMERILKKMAEQIGAVVERLEQSQREVLRSEQLAAVGQMAAGMAHELRNPLMSMKLLVQAAAVRRHSAGLGGRDLGVLEEEITRLERLIQTFLDFARPPQLEKRPFEVREAVEQVVGLVSERAKQRDVLVEYELPARPVVIEADAGQVRQVLLNLLLNALDAVAGGGNVWVRVRDGVRRDDAPGPRPDRKRPAADRWLTVEVTDDGCGLPEQLGPQIFEPFVSTKETGIGLGLSISKRIVEAHGGHLDAAGRPGGGAVFTFGLPCPVEAWCPAPHAAAPRLRP